MALPASPDARLFYRSAKQRYQESLYLLEGEFTTAAVYLAGYAVECMLKALILSRVPRKKARATLGLFRGAIAHDFGWLKQQYLQRGGLVFPKEIDSYFKMVSSWSTDLRYKPGFVKASETEAFLQATEGILDWAEEKL